MTTRVEGSTDIVSELPAQVVSGPDDPIGCGPKLPAFRWGRDERDRVGQRCSMLISRSIQHRTG